MGSRRALALGAALACAAWAGVASADPSEAEKESARTLMDEGDKRIEARDLEGALRAYQAADAIMHVPTTSVEVAKTLALLRRPVAARRVAMVAARFPVEAGEPVPFTQARQEAAALLVLLGGAIASVRVQARGPVDPDKVLLRVDGEVESAGGAIELDPGRHVFVVAADGFGDAQRAVDLREGARETLVVEMTPLARPVPAPPPSPRRGLSPLVPLGFGAAAAGLAVGATFGALSIVRTNRLDDQCDAARTCPDSARDDIDAAETLANVSNVAFGAAIVGAVVGVVGLVVSTRQPAAVRAAPGQAALRVWFR